MNAPEQPRPTLQARLWLIGIVLINVALQLVLALAGIDLPEPIERTFAIVFAILGALSLALVVWILKVDRRSVGLTLGDPKTTFVRTAQQLLILGALAILYTVGMIVAARTQHLTIPVAPTSMTDPHTIFDFCALAILIAPLYEEFVFRGLAIAALERSSRNWITILISAAIFSIPHYFPGRGVAPFIGPFVLGSFLAWSYLRTRSVLTPYLVHAAFNSGVIFKDYMMAYHPDMVRRVLGYH